MLGQRLIALMHDLARLGIDDGFLVTVCPPVDKSTQLHPLAGLVEVVAYDLFRGGAPLSLDAVRQTQATPDGNGVVDVDANVPCDTTALWAGGSTCPSGGGILLLQNRAACGAPNFARVSQHGLRA